MRNQKIETHIRELVASDEIEAAIKLLTSHYAGNGQLNDILIQSGRYQALQKSYRQGIIDFNAVQQHLNQLRLNILEFVQYVQQSPAEQNIHQRLKESYRLSTARIAMLYLLSRPAHAQIGLSLTQICQISRIKNRKYIAKVKDELKALAYIEKNEEEESKLVRWRLTEAGVKLVEDLKDTIIFDKDAL